MRPSQSAGRKEKESSGRRLEGVDMGWDETENRIRVETITVGAYALAPLLTEGAPSKRNNLPVKTAQKGEG